MLYLSLFCFLLLGILIICAVRNKYLKIILAVIFEFFFFLDLIAIFTKATHIDYAFIANIEKSIITVMFTVFLKEVILMVIFIILFNYIGIKLLKKYEEKLTNIKYKYLILLLVVINFSKIGVVHSIYKTADQTVFASENLDLEENLRAVGINPKDYVLKDNIKAEPGKNVVIIYLESLEKNYLDNELFDNITPNLSELREEWSFYDYQDNSGWTTAAMYTSQTGLIPWFGLHGNEIFQNITKTNFPSVGSVLEKAGYNQVFINGPDLKFAGMGNFFTQQGYRCYGDLELDKSYARTGWGVRDKEIFEEAKKKYLELSKRKEPFNLSILTIETHFPKGLPDDRMENLIKTKEKNMEYCVETADYLIGDFINFLKEQPNYENLAIYILPDHRVMGNEINTPITKNLNKKPRDLFLLTNQKSISEYRNTNQRLYFYDIPKIILNGAEIKTNAKFMKDLIPNISVDYFNDKSKEFQNLNLSLIEFNSIKDGLKVERSKNGKIIFKSGKKVIDKFYLNKNLIKYYSLDNNLNIKGNFIINKNTQQYRHELDYSNSEYILLFQLNEDNELEVLLSDYNKNIYEKYNYKLGKKLFSIGKYRMYKSGINISPKTLVNKIKDIKIKNELIKQENLNSYLEYLNDLNDESILIIISALDEASSLYPLYKENLNKLGSKIDFSNKWRWSYLVVFDAKGNNFLEQNSIERLDKQIKIGKNNISLISSGFDKGYISSIKINGIEYSKQRRGLNIVILNKKTGKILDFFNVDTYEDHNLMIKR